MWYCDKNCQNKDWKEGHKFGECGIYKKFQSEEKISSLSMLPNSIFERFLHLLRLYLKITRDPSAMTKQFKLHNGQSRCYNDLIVHYDRCERTKRNYWEEVISLLIEHLDQDVDENLAKTTYFKYFINCVAIDDCYGNVIGFSLSIERSIFDHSCKPNADFSYDGNKIIIKATDEILEGEEVTVSYFSNPTIGNRDDYKRILQESCFLDCQCDYCKMTPEEYNKLQEKLSSLNAIRTSLVRPNESMYWYPECHDYAKRVCRHAHIELLYYRIQSKKGFIANFWICLAHYELNRLEKTDLKKDQTFQKHFKELLELLEISPDLNHSTFSNKEYEKFLHKQLELLGKPWHQVFSPDYERPLLLDWSEPRETDRL